MVRFAAVGAAMSLCLVPAGAMAGQSSASFTVGITIGGAGKAPLRQAKRAKFFTWAAAAISVTQAGYRDVKRVARSGRLYWFEATHSGSRYRIAVSIASGAIINVKPARPLPAPWTPS